MSSMFKLLAIFLPLDRLFSTRTTKA